MRTAVIGFGVLACVVGLLLVVLAPRIAASRIPRSSLLRPLALAGLADCRVESHPRRGDMAFVYCPGADQARRATAALIEHPRVERATVLGADGRTVEVVLA